MENELEIQEQSIIEEIEELEELDIYTKEGIESYADDDGITPTEQAFMNGYLEA